MRRETCEYTAPSSQHMLVGDWKSVFSLWTSFSFLPLSLIRDISSSFKSKADFAALKDLPQLRDFSCQVRPLHWGSEASASLGGSLFYGMMGMPSQSTGPVSWRLSSTAVRNSWGSEQEEKALCQSNGVWTHRALGDEELRSAEPLAQLLLLPRRSTETFQLPPKPGLSILALSHRHCPAQSTNESWAGPRGWEEKSAPFLLFPSTLPASSHWKQYSMWQIFSFLIQ